MTTLSLFEAKRRIEEILDITIGDKDIKGLMTCCVGMEYIEKRMMKATIIYLEDKYMGDIE